MRSAAREVSGFQHLLKNAWRFSVHQVWNLEQPYVKTGCRYRLLQMFSKLVSRKTGFFSQDLTPGRDFPFILYEHGPPDYKIL